MSKSKRKTSELQRDKDVIALAKKMKKLGLLSKQANLHSGKYVSRAVARKVIANQNLAHLNYAAHKVDKATLQAAKERGYTVINNKVVGPSERYFKKRLADKELTGIKPVKGGMLEEVILPHTVFDMKTLVEQLGTGIDTYKLPNEYFAFSIQGRESYTVFSNTEYLLEYLLKYEAVNDPAQNQSLFNNFSILRLHKNESRALVPSKNDKRRIDKNKAWKREGKNQPVNATGRFAPKKRVRPNPYENMTDRRVIILKKKQAEKMKEYRKNNPDVYEREKQRALERYHATKKKG